MSNATDHLKTIKRMATYKMMSKSDLASKFFNLVTKQNVIPSFPEYLELTESLYTGDQPMDELMEWVMTNPRIHRQYFETALYKGLNHLPHPVPELETFFRYIETPPDWVDPNKFQVALRFTHRLGENSLLIMRDLALMGGYQYPGFNQPLILTGALKQYAGKRLAETHKWWLDITRKNGFSRFNDGFTSTIFVRFIHSLVRFQLKKNKAWDWDTWGMPINQYDQAMTNIAFSGVLLLGLRGIGIFPNKTEVDALLHFWKYTGWLMGIQEKWLIDKETEGWRLIQWMKHTHPHIDESSRALAVSLSKEPFDRDYKYFKHFQQKKAYYNHLAVTQFFIGRKKMHELGLETRPFIFYPFYLMAKNGLIYTGAKYIKPLDRYLVKRGRALQENALDLFLNEGKQLATMHR